MLGIDPGERRVGLAISDVTATLARPLATLTVAGAQDSVTSVMREVRRLANEEDGLAGVVVGLPTALDGSQNEQTRRVLAFIDALAKQTTLPVVRVDERLTSREAESRLAVRERDWRVRKSRIDAAAAAILLQDFLDQRARKTREAGEPAEAGEPGESAEGRSERLGGRAGKSDG